VGILTSAGLLSEVLEDSLKVVYQTVLLPLWKPASMLACKLGEIDRKISLKEMARVVSTTLRDKSVCNRWRITLLEAKLEEQSPSNLEKKVLSPNLNPTSSDEVACLRTFV
jgi:hypothetical protein